MECNGKNRTAQQLMVLCVSDFWVVRGATAKESGILGPVCNLGIEFHFSCQAGEDNIGLELDQFRHKFIKLI
jgi:hypothetical protein